MTKSEAIELFGSASRLAEALGITRQAISGWPKGTLSKQREMAVKGAKAQQLVDEQKKLEATQNE